MSTTTTNGYKIPDDGDLGDTWFNDLEDNWARMDGHTHTGSDSERLTSAGMAATSDTILTASFSTAVGTYWRATATVPSGTAVDDFGYMFKDPTTKEQMYLKMEKLNATQYYVFINIAQDVEVYYLA